MMNIKEKLTKLQQHKELARRAMIDRRVNAATNQLREVFITGGLIPEGKFFETVNMALRTSLYNLYEDIK